MEEISSQLLANYYSLVEWSYASALVYYPRLDNYNRFEKFLILNLLVIGLYLLYTTVANFSIYRVYSRFMTFVFNLGPIRRKLMEEM
jgi:hypothetical protein